MRAASAVASATEVGTMSSRATAPAESGDAPMDAHDGPLTRVAFLLAALVAPVWSVSSGPPARAMGTATHRAVSDLAPFQPAVAFEANQGQVDSSVRYLSRMP